MSLRLIFALAAVALSTGLVACNDTLQPEQDLSTTPSLAKGANRSETRIEARLSGSAAFPDASGRARFRDRGGERELQIQVEDGPANAMVTFLVNGTAVGTATTDAIGDASLSLNSDLGNSVPNVAAGTSISVSAGGTVVVSGSF
ncbi:MAG: hypothetical protein ACE5HT_06585 [Gemmatimonadales bacterium]